MQRGKNDAWIVQSCLSAEILRDSDNYMYVRSRPGSCKIAEINWMAKFRILCTPHVEQSVEQSGAATVAFLSIISGIV